MLRNNAPEIRTFQLELTADGLEFSPRSATVTVGVSAVRPVTFRIFAAGAKPGVHAGVARLSGPATVEEPMRLVVIPQTSAVAWAADGFVFLESLHQRASLLPGRFLELVNKDNGKDAVPPGGVSLPGGPLRPSGEEVLAGPPANRVFRLTDLEALVPKAPARRSDATF